MLGRIGSALRARPFLGACTSATVKTSAADVMVQTVIEGRGVDDLDRRRLAGTRHRARTPGQQTPGCYSLTRDPLLTRGLLLTRARLALDSLLDLRLCLDGRGSVRAVLPRV